MRKQQVKVDVIRKPDTVVLLRLFYLSRFFPSHFTAVFELNRQLDFTTRDAASGSTNTNSRGVTQTEEGNSKAGVQTHDENR